MRSSTSTFTVRAHSPAGNARRICNAPLAVISVAATPALTQRTTHAVNAPFIVIAVAHGTPVFAVICGTRHTGIHSHFCATPALSERAAQSSLCQPHRHPRSQRPVSGHTRRAESRILSHAGRHENAHFSSMSRVLLSSLISPLQIMYRYVYTHRSFIVPSYRTPFSFCTVHAVQWDRHTTTTTTTELNDVHQTFTCYIHVYGFTLDTHYHACVLRCRHETGRRGERRGNVLLCNVLGRARPAGGQTEGGM